MIPEEHHSLSPIPFSRFRHAPAAPYHKTDASGAHARPPKCANLQPPAELHLLIGSLVAIEKLPETTIFQSKNVKRNDKPNNPHTTHCADWLSKYGRAQI